MDKEGNIPSNEEDIIKRWKEYFQQLFVENDEVTNSKEHKQNANLKNKNKRKKTEEAETYKKMMVYEQQSNE